MLGSVLGQQIGEQNFNPATVRAAQQYQQDGLGKMLVSVFLQFGGNPAASQQNMFGNS